VKFHSEAKDDCEISFRSQRRLWSFIPKPKTTVKFHSEAKDNCEISFWCQRQLWNFILRPRAAVKFQCNRCADLTNLRNAALQQTRLCIKYSRLVPNVTDSVMYGHHGFSSKNRNKIVRIYGILKCMNLSYMQKCFNDVRILSLKCFSCLSISDKGEQYHLLYFVLKTTFWYLVSSCQMGDLI